MSISGESAQEEKDTVPVMISFHVSLYTWSMKPFKYSMTRVVNLHHALENDTFSIGTHDHRILWVSLPAGNS